MNYFDILFAQKMSGSGGGATKTYTITIQNNTSYTVSILVPCMSEYEGNTIHDFKVAIDAGGTTTATVIVDLINGEEISVGAVFKAIGGELSPFTNYDLVSSSGNTEYDGNEIYFYGDDEITISEREVV